LRRNVDTWSYGIPVNHSFATVKDNTLREKYFFSGSLLFELVRHILVHLGH
jgi:hypothetical protein